MVPEQAVQGQEDRYEAAAGAEDEEQRRRKTAGLRAAKAAGWLDDYLKTKLLGMFHILKTVKFYKYK